MAVQPFRLRISLAATTLASAAIKNPFMQISIFWKLLKVLMLFYCSFKSIVYVSWIYMRWNVAWQAALHRHSHRFISFLQNIISYTASSICSGTYKTKSFTNIFLFSTLMSLSISISLSLFLSLLLTLLPCSSSSISTYPVILHLRSFHYVCICTHKNVSFCVF